MNNPDLEEAKRRAVKSIFWDGYAKGLEGYSSTEAGSFEWVDPALWHQIVPTGNQSKRDIESAIEAAKWAEGPESFFEVGFAAGVERLSLVEAEKRLETDPRHKFKNKPYDGYKIHGVLCSLIFALIVSFLVANALITLFILFIGLLHPDGMSYVLHKHFSDMTWNVVRAIAVMGLESLIWGAGVVAFMGARKYKSLKYVFFKALFGGRGGRSIGPIIIGQGK